MSCPVKFHAIGDFHAYYSGAIKAPYLTIFIGGNHEASSHMWELYYGGWAAPNIYYMGAANVVRLGGVRICGMSGIWKGYNYNKPHHERLPYNQDDIKSIYHIRELDVRKLLQIQTQVDIGISHDWPKAVERHGDERGLFRSKPFFEQESKDGTLGSTAAAYVMDRLRPPYWFAAHMHVKFAATKVYDAPAVAAVDLPPEVPSPIVVQVAQNTDEIDLDMDDDSDSPPPKKQVVISPVKKEEISNGHVSVPENIRAQLPAAFSRPPPSHRTQPGLPVPPSVTNTTVRFLALDKCLPGRKFLQLLEVKSYQPTSESTQSRSNPTFEYDPEWLAITRVFAGDLILGNKNTRPSLDLGEDHYKSLIEKESIWVIENVVKKGKLSIPPNFEITAPPYQVGTPEIVSDGPVEYNNPQTQTYCDLIGIINKFSSTDEGKLERMRNGPAEVDPRFERRGNHGGGRGSSGGRGGGRGRGRDRGGGGRGRGRG